MSVGSVLLVNHSGAPTSSYQFVCFSITWYTKIVYDCHKPIAAFKLYVKYIFIVSLLRRLEAEFDDKASHRYRWFDLGGKGKLKEWRPYNLVTLWLRIWGGDVSCGVVEGHQLLSLQHSQNLSAVMLPSA